MLVVRGWTLMVLVILCSGIPSEESMVDCQCYVSFW